MNPQEHEQAIISYIRNQENFNILAKLGITTETFTFYKEVFEFISQYQSKYGSIPKKDIIESSYPGFKYCAVEDKELRFHIDEIKSFEYRRKASDILHRGIDLINNDVNSGLDFLISKLTSIRKPYIISDSWTDAEALKRLTQYQERVELVKKGLTVGLKTGISFLDEKLLGWMPGNVIAVIGATNKGKSWLAKYSAATVYEQGKRVLFIEPEMSIIEDELRTDVVLGHLRGYNFSNHALASGSKINIKEYENFLKEFAQRKDWHTLSADRGRPFTISSIESVINADEPDFVVIDGFRLIDLQSGRDWMSLEDAAMRLKAIAQAKSLIMMITSQSNLDDGTKIPNIFDVYGGKALSMSCLTADTAVRKASHLGGYSNICDIKIGDYVFTHSGTTNKVTNIFSRDINEEICKLFLENGEIINITKEHRIYTTEGWIEAQKLTTNHILYKLSDFNNMGRNIYKQFGKTPWNKGLTGIKTQSFGGLIWNKGLTKYSDIRMERVSIGVSKTRQKLFKEGKLFAWAKGKTKETDPRLMAISKKLIEIRKTRNFTPEGFIHPTKGKTLEEMHGKEIANQIRKKLSRPREQNANWQGGLSRLPYSPNFDTILKTFIRGRDNHTCQLCGILEVNAKKKYTKNLLIHHINYDKQNGLENNLIALCVSCNSKVNFNRGKWESYFSEKILNQGLKIVNGTKIKKIDCVPYIGKVYNLEVDEDQSYCGRGIIYHNCDIFIGLADIADKANVRRIAIKKNRAGEVYNKPIEIMFSVDNGVIGI